MMSDICRQEGATRFVLTCHSFLDLIQNEIHELIVAFQCADDYTNVSILIPLNF